MKIHPALNTLLAAAEAHYAHNLWSEVQPGAGLGEALLIAASTAVAAENGQGVEHIPELRRIDKVASVVYGTKLSPIALHIAARGDTCHQADEIDFVKSLRVMQKLGESDAKRGLVDLHSFDDDLAEVAFYATAQLIELTDHGDKGAFNDFASSRMGRALRAYWSGVSRVMTRRALESEHPGVAQDIDAEVEEFEELGHELEERVDQLRAQASHAFSSFLVRRRSGESTVLPIERRNTLAELYRFFTADSIAQQRAQDTVLKAYHIMLSQNQHDHFEANLGREVEQTAQVHLQASSDTASRLRRMLAMAEALEDEPVADPPKNTKARKV